MATEKWKQASSSARPTRMIVCGHVLRGYDVSPADFECPVCGAPQIDAPAGQVSRHDRAPTEDLNWDGLNLVEAREVPPERGGVGYPADLQQFLAQLTGSVSNIDLKNQTLRMRARVLGKHGSDPAYLHVLRASAHGSTVRDGCITLPAYSVLLLTGRGAHFIDVAFSGGAVVCCGSDFHGTFRSCTFQKSPVYAVHGASVSLHLCCASGGLTGLIASGPRTSAAMTSCQFQSIYTAVTAEAGATALCKRTQFRHTGTAVMVNDAGSHAHLDACDLQNKKAGAVDIRVFGGTVALRRCTVGACNTALQAAGDTSAVEVIDSSFEDTPCAFALAGHAMGTLRRVRVTHGQITDHKQLHTAVLLGDEEQKVASKAAGAVVMERCSLRGDGAVCRGVEVLHGSRAALLLCAVQTGGAGVVVAQPGSRMVAQRCSLRGVKTAVVAESAGCMLRMLWCDVSSRGEACVVQNGAAATAVDSRFTAERMTDNRGGAEIAGAVSVREKASLRLQGGLLHGGPVAMTVFQAMVRVTGTVVRVRGESGGATGSDSAFYAVCILNGSDAELTQCTFRTAPGEKPGGHRKGAMMLKEAARIAVDRCAFGPHTVVGQPGHSTLFRDCTFGGAAHTPSQGSAKVLGLVFEADGGDAEGAVVVEGCTFGAAERCASVTGVKAAFRSCTFGPGVSDGLCLREGANATVTECEFDGCDVGILQLRRAQLHVEDSLWCGVGTGIKVDENSGGGQVRAVGCTMHASNACVALKHEFGHAQADLVGCTLSGGNIGLHVVFCPADISVDGCTFSGPGYGVLCTSPVRGSIKASTAEGCMTGIHIGAIRELYAQRCRVCGAGGAQGWPQVYAALVASGGRPVDGAACVHAGAMSRVSLRDVSVSKCGTGVYVGEDALLYAVGVGVELCRRGVEEWCVGEPSSYEECKVVTAGALVAVQRWRVHGPESGAATCEHSIPGVEVVNA